MLTGLAAGFILLLLRPSTFAVRGKFKHMLNSIRYIIILVRPPPRCLPIIYSYIQETVQRKSLPEGLISSIIWSVECITRKHRWGGGLTGLYHCRHTNYYRAFRLSLCSFFYQYKPELSPAEQLPAADPSYCWLYIVLKQAVDRFMLFARLYHVLFSYPEHSERASFGSGSIYPYNQRYHERERHDDSQIELHWHGRVQVGE